jgi:hypothetical protein
MVKSRSAESGSIGELGGFSVFRKKEWDLLQFSQRTLQDEGFCKYCVRTVHG